MKKKSLYNKLNIKVSNLENKTSDVPNLVQINIMQIKKIEEKNE